MSRQCELLSLSRSSLYYRPAQAGGAASGGGGESAENLALMATIDRQFVETPFYGVRRMTAWLGRQGCPVNPKRVRRLMRIMGLETIYPRPRKMLTSLGDAAHRKFPYLLKGLTIDRPDQVWAADITYVPLYQGWAYLVAILDWFSRYVLAWELSPTLETDFCLRALERALARGKRPEIFNTDQGSQFTSEAFTGALRDADIVISMDGRGRAFDNIFIERLWRTVKYEDVYIHGYETPAEARLGLGRYFPFYNFQRLHQALDYRTPAEVYGIDGCGAVHADGADTPGKFFAAAGRGLLPPRPLPAPLLCQG
jgi:putative transposase